MRASELLRGGRSSGFIRLMRETNMETIVVQARIGSRAERDTK